MATAINDYDQVAGYWLATNNTSSRAFIYTGGAMQTLPGLGGSFAYAHGIDPAGMVVGEADTSGGVRHAVRWRNGAIEDLNTLLAAGSGWVLQTANRHRWPREHRRLWPPQRADQGVSAVSPRRSVPQRRGP